MIPGTDDKTHQQFAPCINLALFEFNDKGLLITFNKNNFTLGGIFNFHAYRNLCFNLSFKMEGKKKKNMESLSFVSNSFINEFLIEQKRKEQNEKLAYFSCQSFRSKNLDEKLNNINKYLIILIIPCTLQTQ